jgi:metal-sulfur cluster biosynthetic enzyme
MNRPNRVFQYLVVTIILAAVVALLAAMAYSSSIRKSYHWTKSAFGAAVPPVTEDHIRSLLAKVTDPELGVNIVDLGLVYGIRIPSPGAVEVTMTLTTPYCPYNKTIIDDIQKTLIADPAINDARLRIVFEPAWSWNRVDKGVRDRIIKLFSAAPKTGSDSHD